MKNYLDFTFKKGDKLKVFSKIRNRIYDCTFVKYECLCSCGNTKVTNYYSLISKKGGTKSCGCLQKEDYGFRVTTGSQG